MLEPLHAGYLTPEPHANVSREKLRPTAFSAEAYLRRREQVRFRSQDIE